MVDVVFDIGRVLVALQPDRLLGLLREHGAAVRTLEDVTSRIDLTGHETGRLSGSQLLQQIAALAPQPMEVRALEEAWVDMLRPDPAMLQLADRLRAIKECAAAAKALLELSLRTPPRRSFR